MFVRADFHREGACVPSDLEVSQRLRAALRTWKSIPRVDMTTAVLHVSTEWDVSLLITPTVERHLRNCGQNIMQRVRNITRAVIL